MATMAMRLFVNAGRRYSTINKNLYGHFAEHLGRGIYGGIYVGEDSPIPNRAGLRTDVVDALRAIGVPVLRWPGGCFAEYYHWRDGIGPKAGRSHMVNAGWGGTVEDNAFGTHEYFQLCEQLGCDAYVAGNVGSGTPREMSEWLEYMTFAGTSPLADLRRQNGRQAPWPVRFIGVGNENWGCGGHMRPEYYADLYRQFATYLRQYGEEKLHKVACGPDGADYGWTETVMRLAGKFMDGLSLHFYTMPGYYAGDPYPDEKKGPATGFGEAAYYRTLRRALRMDELIARHKAVMDRHDPEGRVALMVDEWGTWHQPEAGTNPSFLFQQNTMRDALVAAVSLNIFNTHSDRVAMANLAQMVNVLQAPVLTEGDRMLLTPTYHVFELYKGHQGATLVESYVQQDEVGTEEARVPALHASASQRADGRLHLTLANLSATEVRPVQCLLAGQSFSKAAVRCVAGAMDSHNTFDAPGRVAVRAAADIAVAGDGFTYTAPACSVTELVLE